MKTMFKLIILSIFLIGCNEYNKEKKISVEQKNTKIKSVLLDSIEYKSKHKTKLFLDFWASMSAKEYEVVSRSLKQEKRIENDNHYFFSGDDFTCEFEIKPEIRNDSLKSINLFSTQIDVNWSEIDFLRIINQRYYDNINGPKKMCSTDLNDILKFYIKKYGNPKNIYILLDSRIFSKNPPKKLIYRWILNNKVINIIPSVGYYHFKDKVIGKVLVSIEIQYIDKIAFMKAEIEKNKNMNFEENKKKSETKATFQDI